MRVYLPYADLRRSAKCLSDFHLNEQRKSCRHLIHALTVPKSYSGDMELVTPWQGHMTALLELTDATLEERRRRRIDERGVTPWMLRHADDTWPPWLGDSLFHTQHKLYLLRADMKHYERMGW